MHVGRLKGGVRRVLRISEIVDVVDGEFVVEDVFGFEQTGIDAEGRATGEFYATGYVPRCLQRFEAAGITLDASLFEARREPGTR